MIHYSAGAYRSLDIYCGITLREARGSGGIIWYDLYTPFPITDEMREQQEMCPVCDSVYKTHGNLSRQGECNALVR
jgi:hypothetical protein